MSDIFIKRVREERYRRINTGRFSPATASSIPYYIRDEDELFLAAKEFLDTQMYRFDGQPSYDVELEVAYHLRDAKRAAKILNKCTVYGMRLEYAPAGSIIPVPPGHTADAFAYMLGASKEPLHLNVRCSPGTSFNITADASIPPGEVHVFHAGKRIDRLLVPS